MCIYKTSASLLCALYVRRQFKNRKFLYNVDRNVYGEINGKIVYIQGLYNIQRFMKWQRIHFETNVMVAGWFINLDKKNAVLRSDLTGVDCEKIMSICERFSLVIQFSVLHVLRILGFRHSILWKSRILENLSCRRFRNLLANPKNWRRKNLFWIFFIIPKTSLQRKTLHEIWKMKRSIYLSVFLA